MTASSRPVNQGISTFDDAAPDIEGDGQALVPPVLKRYWYAVLKRKWLVIAAVVTCLVLGLIATLLTAPKFTATSQIEISREQKKVTNVEGLDVQTGQDQEFYETQYSLLQADSLAQRVVKRLRLATNEGFFASAGVRLNEEEFGNPQRAALTSAQAEARERQAIIILQRFISIDPVRRSRLVRISYTSRSPDLSAQVANAWTEQFIGASMDRQFASTADARKFLEERLASLKVKLEDSERQAVTYATSKGIVALETTRNAEGKAEGQRTLAAADLESLNTALTQATADRIAAESRARGANGDSSPEALTNNTITELRRQRGEAASEYAKLLVQFEPGYPAARALAEKIRGFDQAISRETGRISASRSQVYREALAREDALRAAVSRLRGQFDLQQRDSIQYSIFQREADTNRQLYDALLQRYKEIGVAGNVGVNNIAIVDVAKIPDEPSAPSLPKNMAMALMLGLGVAGAAVFGLEQIDEGVVDPQQISRVLHLPTLGYTPLAVDSSTETMADTKSDLSEAYFSIHSNLAFTTPHGLPKSLMVTSTKPSEGKSTTSTALTRIIGRTGKRVLLIDGDMRSPSLHKLFNLKNGHGLSNALAGNDDLSALVQATSERGISVMTSGPKPPSPAELLSGDRLATLIEGALKHYDHVVVDAPPVLGLTDAPLIGTAVEGCVFVIQAGEVPIRGVRASLLRLGMVNTHIFGAILTKLNQRDLGYGYGYGSGYGYGYEYGDRQA